MEFEVKPGSLASGSHVIAIDNRHLTGLGVYLLNAAQPKSASVQIVKQTRNDTQSTGEIEFIVRQPMNFAKVSGIVLLAAGLAGLLAAFRWAANRSLAVSETKVSFEK